MLPAVAMAFSDSTSQLLELAPEIVRISLRLGLEASRRSAQIEKSHRSWATVVPSVPLEEQREIISDFHNAHVRDSYLLTVSEQKAQASTGDTPEQKGVHQRRVQLDDNDQWATFYTSFALLIFGDS